MNKEENTEINRFIIDINEFELLSRRVGYYDAKSNKNPTKKTIKIYENLRTEQLLALQKLINKYGK